MKTTLQLCLLSIVLTFAVATGKTSAESMRLKGDLPAPVKLVGPATADLRQRGGVIELDLKRGEEVILYSGTKPDEFVITPLPHPDADCNSWGAKSRK